MASNMTDQQFTKGFSIFLALGIVLTLFLILLGNIAAGTITERVRAERNEMAASGLATQHLQPVGQLNLGESASTAESTQVAAAASVTVDGAQVYQLACMACHTAGVAGAPKLGDTEAWSTRVTQGAEALYTHAISGFQGSAGMMPPKGGNLALSDDEVKAAVDYMLAQSQ